MSGPIRILRPCITRRIRTDRLVSVGPRSSHGGPSRHVANRRSVKYRSESSSLLQDFTAHFDHKVALFIRV